MLIYVFQSDNLHQDNKKTFAVLLVKNLYGNRVRHLGNSGSITASPSCDQGFTAIGKKTLVSNKLQASFAQ